MRRKTKYDRVGRPSENPPIKIWWKEDGKKVEFKETFKTIADAARKVDGDIAAIHKCLNGIRDTHKGYHYEFTDPEYHKEEIEQAHKDRISHRRYSSIYPGIYRRCYNNRWSAYVYTDNSNEKILIGHYDTEVEAVNAQREACEQCEIPWPIRKLHGT